MSSPYKKALSCAIHFEVRWKLELKNKSIGNHNPVPLSQFYQIIVNFTAIKTQMLMKLKFLLFSVLSLSVLLSINSAVKSNASGAPAQRTGAPQDNNQTCNDAANGCHSGNKVNDTSMGKLVVQLLDSGGNSVTTYTGGKSYVVNITLTAGSNAMGFESTIFKGTSKTHAGTLTNGGHSNVQVNFNYATHTSSAIAKNGVGNWKLSWKAPAKGTGTVNIYTAANAADGDQTSSGDYIYKDVLSVTEATVGIDEAKANVQNILIYPNPVKEAISVNYTLLKPSILEIELTDINGHLVQRLFNGHQAAGEYSFHNGIDKMAPGLYFLRMTTDGISVYRKVLVQ